MGTVPRRDMGTLMGVWAHPDDDIYLTAGLMASSARAGNRVVDVTATRGEGGSQDHERWPPEQMAEIRTRELTRSLEVLGITEHRFLNGPVDVDMDTPLDGSGAEQVLQIMQEVQPDTVLTFGPEGMTGHQAHKDVCRWATEAFEKVAKPGARLMYATYTPEWVEGWIEQLEPFNIFRPGTPPLTPAEELAISYGLPDDILDMKFEAIKAHESQVEGLVHVFGDRMREWMAREFFRLAGQK